MRPVPFHRRILPWIFGITFVAMAPAVVFYTSGYRYDAKRGKVERNGTVIIDTVPSGAMLSVDGRDSGRVTPVTIQDMPPGAHTFAVSKTGYSSWQKTLEIYPELVTFADHIHLWPTQEPGLVSTLSGARLASPDDGSRLLVLASSTRDTPSLRAFSVSTLPNFHLSAPSATDLPIDASQARVMWSDDNRYALAVLPTGQAWLLNVTGTSKPIALPVGEYRWEGKIVVGTSEHALLTITADGSLTRNTLPANTSDRIDGFELRTVSSTSQLVLFSPDQPGKGYVLPRGDWHFWSHDSAVTFLRDGTHWLAITIADDGSFHSEEAFGDDIRLLQDRKGVRALLFSEHEIWVWDPTKQPDLVYRQSNSVIQALWNNDGNQLFFASPQTAYALELDPRDGRRLVELAHFDQLNGIALHGTHLLFLGEKNGTQGLWSEKIE